MTGEHPQLVKVQNLIVKALRDHGVSNEMGNAAMIRMLALGARSHEEPDMCIEGIVLLIKAEFERGKI